MPTYQHWVPSGYIAPPPAPTPLLCSCISLHSTAAPAQASQVSCCVSLLPRPQAQSRGLPGSLVGGIQCLAGLTLAGQGEPGHRKETCGGDPAGPRVPVQTDNCALGHYTMGLCCQEGRRLRQLCPCRVLRVGGTLVLLLNEDPHKLFSGWSEAGTALFPKGGPLDEHGLPTRGGPVPERGTRTGVGVVGTEPPPGGMACGEGITTAQPLLGSLVPVGQYCVSLGKTEAFLCKYKKVTITAGTRPEKPSPSGLAVEEDPVNLQDPGPQAPLQT